MHCIIYIIKCEVGVHGNYNIQWIYPGPEKQILYIFVHISDFYF